MFQKPYHIRLLIVLALFCSAVVGLGARLVELQVVKHKDYNAKAAKVQIGETRVLPKRGNIYDRNRHELAVSSLRHSLYCDTSRVTTDSVKRQIAEELAKVLPKSAEEIYHRMCYEGHPPIARRLDPVVGRMVADLIAKPIAPEQALYFQYETKRQHPKGGLACHVLGFTQPDDTGDNLGQAGLELQYNEIIRGNLKKANGYRDALKKRMTPVGREFYRGSFGKDLILTLDESIQHVAEKALLKAVSEFGAKSGVVVVQKCKTGEILALANVPSFELDEYWRTSPEQRKNRAVSDAFNMGSIMKIFTASALIETGTIGSLDQEINCHDGEAFFPPRRTPIRDAPGHELGIVPFRTAFRYSSNCGMVEACRNLEPYEYHRILSAFGFGARTGVDLPGEVTGILHPLSEWTNFSMLALPFGGEMTESPIQVATAVSAVANDGLVMRPHIVKEIRTYEGALVERIEPTVVRRAISPATARKVLELMEDVVGHETPDGKWDGGTGKTARIPNYRVGGKTGTYKYIVPRAPGDSVSSYTASFAAVLPLPDPELTILCCIDQPKSAKYGGTVAAPVVREVAENALRILGIPPQGTDRNSEQIEMRIDDLARRDAPRTPGRVMPVLKGMTMREAANRLADLDLEITFKGHGVVVVQDPPAGTSLRGHRQCTLVLGGPAVPPAE